MRTLRLSYPTLPLDLSLLEELRSLECLEVVTTVIRSYLVMEKLLYAPRVANCIESVNIEGLHEESFTVMTLPTMANLSFLSVWRCGMREIKTPTTTCFQNLSTVVIAACNGLKDLLKTLLS